MVSRAMDFKIGGSVLLSAPCSSRVCVFGFLSSWCGSWREMGPDVILSSGNLFCSAKIDDVFKKDFFLILSLGSQLSTISLHGLSSSNRRNLSRVRAVFLSRLSLRGSTFASISQALVGVVFRAPHTNLSPWFWRRSSFL